MSRPDRTQQAAPLQVEIAASRQPESLPFCMHVHVQWSAMRTTIELKPEHRAKLLELAARRGEKGFSLVIAEAIETYLEGRRKSDHLTHKALRLRGKLSLGEATRLRRYIASLRANWR